ncbi:Ff.00g064970.m01.CDS01 [Fusarium sp. VM40]|nr:Ff.00g064970.m01.CDS01 [Fusarium sp. VM40]
MSISSGKSLHDLSVENPWFAVHPLFWTARHLRLLQCSFSLQPPEATSDSDSNTNIHDHGDGHDASRPGQDEDELTRNARRLASTQLVSLKALSVKKLLCPQGSLFYEVRGSPPFKFNNRRIHLPECDIYRVTTPNTPDTQPQAPPIIGYFHYDDVTKDREKALTPRLNPRGGFNWPVARLYQRRLHGVTPDLWSQDPYLICLLLSLAQLQWRGEGSKSTTYPASLLVTNTADTTHAHVFQADIPSDILQGLHEPKSNIHAVWPSIKHTKVPFEPYTNFSERIITHLVGVQYKSSVNVATTDATATPTAIPAETTTAIPTATPTAISTTTTPTPRINKRKFNDANVPAWELSPKRHAQGRQTPQCAGA